MRVIYKDEEILALIPQRAPIVMVDLLQNMNDSSAETGLLIKEDNIFVKDELLQEGGIIEHIAQSAAAFAGWRDSREGSTPKLGYIGEIKKMRLHQAPHIGNRLETQLEILGEAGGITLLSAITQVKGEIVAEGMMKIFLKED